MRINKFALLFGLVITAILFAEVAGHASAADELTKITFKQPIQIPGQVLPPGTYVFKLMDPNNLDVVQIFNADGTRLYASLQTNSTELPEPPDTAVVTLAEPGAGRPDALLKWFYAGDVNGHEFVYSQGEEEQLAQYPRHTIVTKDMTEAGD